jgi:group I intron endonuclease
LQRSIKKYGLSNFNILIYYFHRDPAVLLTDIETNIISKFSFSSLYNITTEATSMIGYKHTKAAIEKMKLRFIDKKNHPMFGKQHKDITLQFISKPGALNPMFGKKILFLHEN